MRSSTRGVIVALFLWGIAACPSAAQKLPKPSEDNVAADQASGRSRTLTPDDGLAVIAAALDSHIHLGSKPDCSHLVHAIYDRAGFPYRYAPSSDLYVGTRQFQRVPRPQVGDLVVWRGHSGIVVDPAQHIFFSSLRSGLGTDSYEAPYWKERGGIRFYRYIKGSLASSHLTKTHR